MTKDGLAGLSLYVSVTVPSTYELKAVHAQVETIGGDLAPPTDFRQLWTGYLPIGPLPRGTKTLTITATDLLNNVQIATVAFTHDNPPVITTPFAYPLATKGMVHVTATCADDDTGTGCVSFKVSVCSQTLTSGTANIDGTLDLSACNGSPVSLILEAKDSISQYGQASAELHVDNSSDLVPVATVPGTLFDFDATRLLYRNVTTDAVVLRKRADSNETTLGASAMLSPVQLPPYGWLTSSGAGWVSMIGLDRCTDTIRAFDWRGGTTTRFYEDCRSYNTLRVNGDYAAWPMSTETNVPTLRNMATGATTGFSSIVGALELGLAPDGSIAAFGSGWSSILTRRGSDWVMIPMSNGALYAGLVFDGSNIVCSATSSDIDIRTVLIDSTGVVVPLSEPEVFQRFPPEHYAVNSGWTAYLKRGPSGKDQVCASRSCS